MPRQRLLGALCAIALIAGWSTAASGQQKTPAGRSLTLLSVQSANASGLLDSLSARFQRRSGISVTVIARSAGDVMRLASEGKGDAVLLNDLEGETELIKRQTVVDRKDVTYTEMVVVGPKSDPAGVIGMTSVIDALRLIATSKSAFISRGDDSGVHRAEKRFWKEAGVNVGAGAGAWYSTLGADMRTALGVAASKNAYTLTDMAAWLRFQQRRAMVVVVNDDPRLQLRYGISLVNPKKHATVRRGPAVTFIRWLTSKHGGQKAIANFTIGDNRPYSPHVDLRSE